MTYVMALVEIETNFQSVLSEFIIGLYGYSHKSFGQFLLGDQASLGNKLIIVRHQIFRRSVEALAATDRIVIPRDSYEKRIY